MNQPRNRALRSPLSHETMLGDITGAGNPALTDRTPTPPERGLKTEPTCRAKSDTGHPLAAKPAQLVVALPAGGADGRLCVVAGAVGGVGIAQPVRLARRGLADPEQPGLRQLRRPHQPPLVSVRDMAVELDQDHGHLGHAHGGDHHAGRLRPVAVPICRQAGVHERDPHPQRLSRRCCRSSPCSG